MAIAPLLSGKATDCGVTAKANRLFFNAVVLVIHSNCPWANLPERFGLSNTAWRRLHRLAQKGVWKRIFTVL